MSKRCYYDGSKMTRVAMKRNITKNNRLNISHLRKIEKPKIQTVLNIKLSQVHCNKSLAQKVSPHYKKTQTHLRKKKNGFRAASYKKGRDAGLLDLNKTPTAVSNKYTVCEFSDKKIHRKNINFEKELDHRKTELQMIHWNIKHSRCGNVMDAAKKFKTNCPDKIFMALVGNVPCYGVQFNTIDKNPKTLVIWFKEYSNGTLKEYAMKRIK